MKAIRTARWFVFVAGLLLLIVACRQSPFETTRKEKSPPPRTVDPGVTISDLGPVGSGALGLLRAAPYTEVTLEVAFVEGRRPSESATNHLRDVLAAVTGKPVSVLVNQIPAGDGSYSFEEIRSLSGARRTKSAGSRASIWIAYLDGESAHDRAALGVSVAATVAAFFPDRVATLGALLNPEGIERAVVLHEVGHLLALVNIGYKSNFDHEDPEHPNHSRNRGSVMYWAVEDISVATVFSGGPPDNFDDADRADLQMLKSS